VTPASDEGGRVLRRSLIIRAGSAPFSALLGVLNSAVIVAATGSPMFGVITLVSTLAQQLPFADLGIGGIVTTAVARHRLNAASANEARATVLRAVTILNLVATTLILLGIFATLSGAWKWLFSFPLSPSDQWWTLLAVAIFAVNIPISLTSRVVTGLGKNELVVAANAVSSLVILGVTALFYALGSSGMEFALPAVLGPLVVNIGLFIYLAGKHRTAIRPRLSSFAHAAPRPLLSGAVWLLLINIGLPLGLQSGRYIVAHGTGSEELAAYALAMQIYTAAWGILAVASSALWSAFVGLRGDPARTLVLWRRSTAQLTSLAVLFATALVFGGPWVIGLISGGQTSVDWRFFLGFAVLLLAQAAHLPAGAALTFPSELRWQAGCVIAMGSASVILAFALVPVVGSSGAAVASGVSVLLCQFVPDTVWIKRLLKRRTEGNP